MIDSPLCRALAEAMFGPKYISDDELENARAILSMFEMRDFAVVPIADEALEPNPAPAFDFLAHLHRQREFSERTFGPGDRAKGVVAHIRKELAEIEADPDDLTEWIDVVILALDGAWRSGASPEAIVAALVAKQTRNEARQWPDWRTVASDAAIEHVRSPSHE